MDRIETISRHLRLAEALCASKKRVRRADASAKRHIGLDEIVAQRKAGKCWIVLKNHVYDVTEFLEEHPGGEELITDIAPTDVDGASLYFCKQKKKKKKISPPVRIRKPK